MSSKTFALPKSQLYERISRRPLKIIYRAKFKITKPILHWNLSLMMRSLKWYLHIPIPTHLLKKSLSALLPTVTGIINNSLITGSFSDQLKLAHVRPDRDDLQNCLKKTRASKQIKSRMISNRLKLNYSKTEVLIMVLRSFKKCDGYHDRWRCFNPLTSTEIFE